jgi:hypothetical protein
MSRHAGRPVAGLNLGHPTARTDDPRAAKIEAHAKTVAFVVDKKE